MKTVKHKKRFLIIGIALIFIVVAGCIAGYIGYGSTMINPDNEESVINYLSTDKNRPINIIETKKYGNYFVILYTNPVKTEENKYSSQMDYFVKHKFYSNRYVCLGGSGGNQTQQMVHFTHFNDSDGSTLCFIGDLESDETRCSAFELGEDLDLVRKLDEFEVPKTSYIIVKQYKLKNERNYVVFYDGSSIEKDLTGE